MSEKKKKKLFLEKINSPEDLKSLNIEDLKILSTELREELIEIVSKTGGHLGACLLYTSPSPRDLVISRMPSSA